MISVFEPRPFFEGEERLVILGLFLEDRGEGD
jgi:hypothetical protein